MNVEALTEQLAPVVQGLGYELWGIELVPDAKQLRIYIDKASGINIDDCSRVNRQLRAVLAVDSQLPDTGLEVSSPGLERRLFKLMQYQAYVGQQIVLECHVPQAGRRRFKGQLLEVEEAHIDLSVDGEPIRLPFVAIKKAHVVPIYE